MAIEDDTLEPNPTSSSAPLLGTVLAVQANYYWVKLTDQEIGGLHQAGDAPEFSQPERSTLLCTRRTRLKKIGQQVMVGDRVQVEEPDWRGGRGAISQVLPRHSELDRPPVANADQVLLVFALAEPDLDPAQLSRFLIKAESTSLEVHLGLSKRDLISVAEQIHWQERIGQWGYQPVLFSVQADPGLGELEERLQGRVTVISGPSGVGKSSLINRLIPNSNLRVAAVSGKLGRGRHTTRHVELYELPLGGLLADTPGFNQPSLDCTPEELAAYFPEIQARLAMQRCQFSDCLHRDEPNCAVRGEWERYPHYLDLLQEAIVRQEAQEKLGTVDAALKLKTRRDGQQQYEPRLETKKYRRQSRRTQQQVLRGEIDQESGEASEE